MSLDTARAALKEALSLAESLRSFADPNDSRKVQFNRAWDAARREAEAAAKLYADEIDIFGLR
jgi:hypothetical protein